MNKSLDKIDDFIDSKWFIITMATFFFFMWFSKFEVECIFVLGAIMPFFVTRKNGITALLVMCVMVITGISMTDVPFEILPGNRFENEGTIVFIIAIVFTVVTIASSLIYHFIKYKPKMKSNCFYLFLPTILLLLPIMLAGIGSGNYNILQSLLVVAFMVYPIVLSALFSFAEIKKSKDYFSWIVIAIALVIVVEMLVFYLKTDNILESFLLKKIELAWGYSNTIAPMMSMGFFMAMYMFAKSNNVIYFAYAVVIGVAMVFSFSRGCLMLFAIAAPLSAVLCIAVSKKKLVPVLCISVVLIILAVLVGVYWQELSKALKYFTDRGFNESNRDIIRIIHLKGLDGNWLFGQAFIDLTTEFTGEGVMTAHSSLITALSATGIFGTVFFGYYYFKKYAPIFLTKSKYNLFFGLAMLVFIGYAFFDTTFYLVYQNVMVLVLMEGAKREHMQHPEKHIKSKAIEFYKNDIFFLIINALFGIGLFALGLIYSHQTIFGVITINPFVDYILYSGLFIAALIIFFPAIERLIKIALEKFGVTKLLKDNLPKKRNKMSD